MFKNQIALVYFDNVGFFVFFIFVNAFFFFIMLFIIFFNLSEHASNIFLFRLRCLCLCYFSFTIRRQISSNTYACITIFLKKSNNDHFVFRFCHSHKKWKVFLVLMAMVQHTILQLSPYNCASTNHFLYLLLELLVQSMGSLSHYGKEGTFYNKKMIIEHSHLPLFQEKISAGGKCLQVNDLQFFYPTHGKS